MTDTELTHELTQAREQAAAELARIDADIAVAAKAQRQVCIAQVRSLMAEHGITMQDIGARPVAVTAMRAAKYHNDRGQTWTGLGKRPNWLRDALSAGRTLDEFRIAA